MYVDGNHFYEYVKKDLVKCIKKVRKGGYVTGDDFDWGEKHGFPVRKAVTEIICNWEVKLEEVRDGQYILENSESVIDVDA
ncbi:hypothetical protein GGP60_001241 [Salinibacter ruber]|nr:hypothetical protein [Salinibacter ruber]